jgi:hypothetical protein
MLVFVIPLRNPEIAQDWNRCNALCQQTVRSALAQTHSDVRVIVSCKDFTPDVCDDRLIVLRHPYETPARTWDDQHNDKYRKIGHGLVEARRYAPCYVMKLDADDLVDRRLSSIAHGIGHKPGYYIDNGYVWAEGSRFVRSVDNFHLACGSTNIIWCEKDELPSSVHEDMFAYPLMRMGHNITVREYEKRGTPLMPIRSPGAIYRISNGENITSHFVRSGLTYTKPNWKFWVGAALRLTELRPLTRSMRRDFFG